MAVSCDDIDQNITHVVRGNDLLDTTPQQQLLIALLGKHIPVYAHIPVIAHSDGHKLSKQNHAQALNDDIPTENIFRALVALGMLPPRQHFRLDTAPTALLIWAIENWQRDNIPRKQYIIEGELPTLR